MASHFCTTKSIIDVWSNHNLGNSMTQTFLTKKVTSSTAFKFTFSSFRTSSLLFNLETCFNSLWKHCWLMNASFKRHVYILDFLKTLLNRCSSSTLFVSCLISILYSWFNRAFNLVICSCLLEWNEK